MFYSDPESARIINRLRVLNLIHQNRNISRAELSRQLKLNKVTVSTIVSGLLDEDLVQELGKSSGTPGRNAMSLGINTSGRYLYVFDIGLWKTRCGICDLGGRLVFKDEFYTPGDHSIEVFLQSMERCIKRLKEQLSGQYPAIGTALAVSGLVDGSGGVVRHSPNWNWRNIELRSILESRLKMPVVIDNNVRTMLMAEQWYGDIKKTDTVFYINWAQGIGSALMVEGRILPVDSEFGHLQVTGNGECSCGKTGCIEAHASGRILQKTGNTIAGSADLSVDELFVLAEKEPELQKLFRFAAMCIGRGASAVANTLSPELIIIGGGLANPFNRYFSYLDEAFTRQTMDLIKEKTKIKISSLGGDAGLLGAAALGLDNLIYKRSSLKTLEAAVFP